jgi:hypothetical protein
MYECSVADAVVCLQYCGCFGVDAAVWMLWFGYCVVLMLLVWRLWYGLSGVDAVARMAWFVCSCVVLRCG